MTNGIELQPCPFCGGQIELLACDDEGNIHDEAYMDDPWSGLCFALKHEYKDRKECPIATHKGEILGIVLYDSAEEAIEAWNNRVEPKGEPT